MTVQELYKRFLLMVNKNDTNEGINISPANFVLLFNGELTCWLGEEIKKGADNIDSNLIQLLYLSDFEVEQVGVFNEISNFIEYSLPVDFYQLYGGYSIADKGSCTNVTIWNWEKKPGDNIAIRSDENSVASFEYQEAPFVVGDNKLKVYYDDYTIKQTFINYYRVPRYIQMEGYINFDGTPSVNIDPEFDDDNTLEILARVVAEVNRQIDNPEGLQLAKDRIQKEY
jgi:hypothetical protein